MSKLNKLFWLLLPRSLYSFLWAVYAGTVNCHALVFGTGFFRSVFAGLSVDADGNAIPWYSYPALDYLKGRDLSELEVFEFGTGYSTAWFSKHAKSVIGVETQAEWRDKVATMVGKNSTIILAKTKLEYIAAINLHSSYDIIVIDGDWRTECASSVLPKLRPGGMIIVDDATGIPVTGGSEFTGGKEAAKYFEGCGLLRVDFFGFAPIVHYQKSTAIFIDTRKP